MEHTQGSLFGRTSQARSAATTEPTSQRFSRAWWEETFGVPPTAGPTLVLPLDPMVAPSGALSTLNISVCPNDAAESSLSTILEANAPARYYLSPRACAGILRRAERRGKPLPAPLRLALEQVASREPTEP